jgi:isopenicillin-N N-acyltransferase like protein
MFGISSTVDGKLLSASAVMKMMFPQPKSRSPLRAPHSPPQVGWWRAATPRQQPRQRSCHRRHVGIVWLLLGICVPLAAAAAEDTAQRTYREGRYEKAELRYINDLPVLIVEGTPDEIGRQKAALTTDAVNKLLAYPQELLKRMDREDQWPRLLEMAESLVPQFPPDHRQELRTFAEASGVRRELGIVANTMADVYRGGFACSSLVVEADRSATHGPLFGRNFDFYSLGMLEHYSLVTVHRPSGKHAFASIGFPGIFGCFSGINDTGLALAAHEVFLSHDNSSLFNRKGVPYSLCFRRVLEECTTIEEAEKLVRDCERTTKLNLVLCDRNGGAVLEMTPKTVILRRSENGLCACTNHFRSRELAFLPWCYRYNTLMKSKSLATLDIADVATKLHQVNQGALTVQTMIFEPQPLVLHLAIGSCPASAHPLKRLELKPLLRP